MNKVYILFSDENKIMCIYSNARKSLLDLQQTSEVSSYKFSAGNQEIVSSDLSEPTRHLRKKQGNKVRAGFFYVEAHRVH